MAKLGVLKCDRQKSEQGVWVPWILGMRLKIARFGNPKFKAYVKNHGKDQKWLAKIGALEGNEDVLEDVFSDALAHTVLLDWENVEDDNGNPIPYTPEIGAKYLRDPDYYELTEFVAMVSRDRETFRHHEAEQVEKNS